MKIIPLLNALSIIVALTSCARIVIPPDPAESQKCASVREKSAIGEVLSLANGCKQVFPDLNAAVDQTMKPLRDEHPDCFAEYERPGPARDQLRAAVELGKGGLSQNKAQFCVTDLSNGVKAVQTHLKK